MPPTTGGSCRGSCRRLCRRCCCVPRCCSSRRRCCCSRSRCRRHKHYAVSTHKHLAQLPPAVLLLSHPAHALLAAAACRQADARREGRGVCMGACMAENCSSWLAVLPPASSARDTHSSIGGALPPHPPPPPPPGAGGLTRCTRSSTVYRSSTSRSTRFMYLSNATSRPAGRGGGGVEGWTGHECRCGWGWQRWPSNAAAPGTCVCWRQRCQQRDGSSRSRSRSAAPSELPRTPWACRVTTRTRQRCW